VLVVGLRLREAVVEHDVDGVVERLVAVDLGNDDALAVSVDDVGQAHQHDVVVIHERHGDGSGPGRRLRLGHGDKVTHLGGYRARLRGHRMDRPTPHRKETPCWV
jgi:hypothetical protein